MSWLNRIADYLRRTFALPMTPHGSHLAPIQVRVQTHPGRLRKHRFG